MLSCVKTAIPELPSKKKKLRSQKMCENIERYVGFYSNVCAAYM